jgi:hypothetical protein
MIKQILYLLLFNLTKQENRFLVNVEEDGIDSRAELYVTPTIEETVRNMTINMEKQNLLENLQNRNLSVYTKLLLIESYFGSSNSIAATTNNIFGGGLLKDSDFHF